MIDLTQFIKDTQGAIEFLEKERKQQEELGSRLKTKLDAQHNEIQELRKLVGEIDQFNIAVGKALGIESIDDE